MVFKRSDQDGGGLGPREEALWDGLRQRVEGGDDFLWCFISSDAPEVSGRFLERLRRLAKKNRRKVSVKETSLASRLPKLAQGLATGRWVARYDYVWLQASGRGRGSGDKDWQQAWKQALLFLSARREALEERFQGIIVSGPPGLKEWLPGSAPSIWPLDPMTIGLGPSAAAEGDVEGGEDSIGDEASLPEGRPAEGSPDVASESGDHPVEPASAAEGEAGGSEALVPGVSGDSPQEPQEQEPSTSTPDAEPSIPHDQHMSQDSSSGHPPPADVEAEDGPSPDPFHTLEEGDEGSQEDPESVEPTSSEADLGALADDQPSETPLRPGEMLREALDTLQQGDWTRTVELTRQIVESSASPSRRAEAYALRAQAERQAGRFSDAARHISLALGTLESEERRDLLRWYDLAGRIAIHRHRLEDALDYYQRALEIARRRAHGDPGSARQRSLSVLLNRLTEVQLRRGQHDDARRLGSEALQLRRQLVEDASQPTSEALTRLSYCYYLLSMVEESAGQLEEAFDYVRESLILDRRLSEENPGPASRRNLAATLKLAAHLKRRMGHRQESRSLLRQAAALKLGSDH
ncbi:MAG TPA: hypothetical protein VLV83_24790 [Acidobacteriota bacterium]|nr:hypothetical protein [Acidobacteriota bacterium]